MADPKVVEERARAKLMEKAEALAEEQAKALTEERAKAKALTLEKAKADGGQKVGEKRVSLGLPEDRKATSEMKDEPDPEMDTVPPAAPESLMEEAAARTVQSMWRARRERIKLATSQSWSPGLGLAAMFASALGDDSEEDKKKKKKKAKSSSKKSGKYKEDQSEVATSDAAVDSP